MVTKLQRYEDALKAIVAAGTRERVERIGDMYAEDGYREYIEQSDEALIAIEALSGVPR